MTYFMKHSHIPMQTRKIIACILHLLFLTVMFAGIGIMYLNDNFGVGITRIKNVAYEDTREFNQQVNKDLNSIFQYIEYNDVFGSGGSIDVSQEMLRMTFGPNETESFSLTDIITYLQAQGYQLDETFQCRKVSDDVMYPHPKEGYIDWSASEPDKLHTYITPGMRRTSLEEISLEIMDVLHQYYTTYNRMFANPSNLHFKIEYIDETSKTKRATIYTNDPELEEDTVRDYGRYAYLSGNSVFYDTNLSSIALSTILPGRQQSLRRQYLLPAGRHRHELSGGGSLCGK